MNNNSRAGIPTMYNGIQYRSRLEARWACILHLSELETVVYEPFDADGYIPDFLVMDGQYRQLIEVKPVSLYEEYVETMEDVLKRLGNHWRHTVCVAGISPKQPFFMLVHTPGIDKFTHYDCPEWLRDDREWSRICNITQWNPPTSHLADHPTDGLGNSCSAVDLGLDPVPINEYSLKGDFDVRS